MQTLLDKNYFDIFGLDEAFSLDQAGLRERFRKLQRKYHPDNYAAASEIEKRMSAQYAAQINQAFTTLKDPVLRARYMLQSRGYRADEKTHMDTAFLMEQMELREELEQTRQLEDGLSALMQLADRVGRDYDAKTAELAEALEDPAGPRFDDADRLVRELQFFDRMRQEIEEVEEAYL